VRSWRHRRPAVSAEDSTVRIAEINGRVSKHVARVQVVPVVAVAIGAMVCTYIVSSNQLTFGFNQVVGILLAIVSPMVIGKGFWDRRQKVRQRKVISDLERRDANHVAEIAKLRDEILILRGQLIEARRGALGEGV
jgi:uncharacterized membrane protein YccC